MKLDHMVVMVRSMTVSEPWYRTLLSLIGFTPSRQNVWGNADGVFIDLKEANADTRDYERRGPGLNHLGFTAPTMADLDRCAPRWRPPGSKCLTNSISATPRPYSSRIPTACGLRLAITVDRTSCAGEEIGDTCRCLSPLPCPISDPAGDRVSPSGR